MECILFNAPQARNAGLVVETVDGDTVIFDSVSNAAHCLSGATAGVWSLSNGTTSVDAIARRLDLETFEVDQALVELDQLNLLESGVDRESLSRRVAVGRLAKGVAAAGVVPLAYSLSIGAASAAASPVACSQRPCAGATRGAAQQICRSPAAQAAGCQSTSNCSTFGFEADGVTLKIGNCTF